MRTLAFFLAFAALTSLFGACGPSEQAEREWMNIPPMDTSAQTQKTTFETLTDTVTTDDSHARGSSSTTTYTGATVRFTVQIGSFKEGKLASAVQAAARQRYQLPVVNDYSAQRKRYQVRIGFFETEDAASQFCAKLKAEFKEYKDAWVAQINN